MNPSDAELAAHLVQGRAAMAGGDWTQAARLAALVLDKRPDHADALVILAESARNLGDFEGARDALRRAIAQADYSAPLHAVLGLVELALGRPAAAAGAFAAAAARDPFGTRHWHNLGRTLALSDQPSLAAIALAHVLVLEPENIEAWADVAGIFRDNGQIETAILSANRALQLSPGFAAAQWNRALARLQGGDFPGGFADYESRWNHGPFRSSRRHPDLPTPDRKSIAGRTVLVWCEQGAGDAIQFSRYLPHLIRAGAHIRLEAPRRLHAILATLDPRLELIDRDGPPPTADAAIGVCSLPHLFDGWIPPFAGYLSADAERRRTWRSWLEGLSPTRPRLTIGIAWQGNPKAATELGRSVPLREFRPLAQIPDIRLVVLQSIHGLDQIPDCGFADRLVLPPDLDSGGSAFVDTAALMKEVDLVVTSDTAVPHLAGALGVPVFLAVKLVPDWRWLLAGQTSPWYSTMTIFRQVDRGRWDDVFVSIAETVRRQT